VATGSAALCLYFICVQASAAQGAVSVRLLIFFLILIAVVDGISKLMNLGWPKLIICILILAPVLIYALRIEGMPIERRGRPLLFGLVMAIPTAVLLALVLSSDGLFS
jgi:hypothetical protein